MSNQENGPNVPETKFDPNLFYELTTNPVAFRRILPDFVGQIAQEADPPEASIDLREIRGRIRGLWTHGSSELLFWTSRIYSREQNWWSGRSVQRGDGRPVQISRAYTEFDQAQRSEWENFIKSGTPSSRKLALKALNILALRRCMPIPKVKDTDATALNQRYDSLRFQLAVKIFPDINNREMFSLRRGDEVRRLAACAPDKTFPK